MRVAMWYLSFGLLPLWLAIIFVLEGSADGDPSYWIVAPWLIILALPLCGVTLLIAALTHRAYQNTQGTSEQKFGGAARLWGLQVALVLAALLTLWFVRAHRERNDAGDEEAGRLLVERSDWVAKQVPGQLVVTFDGAEHRYDELAYLSYYVSTRGNRESKWIAVVRASGEPGRHEVELACMYPSNRKLLSSGRGGCDSAGAIRP